VFGICSSTCSCFLSSVNLVMQTEISLNSVIYISELSKSNQETVAAPILHNQICQDLWQMIMYGLKKNDEIC
jgi:hypothetical protein